MIPGRQYKPEDIVKIAWRRRWLILCPFVVVSALVLSAIQALPSLYQSSTLILVVPQQVAENYVRPSLSARLDDRLQSIKNEILSRTGLEEIIKEFNLYKRARRDGLLDGAIKDMQSDIDF